FVGAFVIYNTFSILVTQRTRELALLRALGASRRQVLGAVLGEALAVGLVASIVGIAFGLVIALGLQALLRAVGITLPSTGTVILPRTIIVALAVGVLTTLFSSLGPARRVSRVPPIAALRDPAPVPSAPGKRTILGLAVTAIGVVLLLVGLFGHA